jgi:hypothetical protein
VLHLANILESRERSGHLAAVLPRQLCTEPLWLHPRTASCVSTMHRRWWDVVDGPQGLTRWEHHTEVANPLAANDRAASSPHGLLRYLDLDVLMALSHAWVRQGADDLAVRQADLLRWMGYDSLLTAPYAELLASLHRLHAVQLCCWSGSARPATPALTRLVDGLHVERQPSGTTYHIRLSNSWRDALFAGHWQEIDLDGYAHLTRTQRRDGLARVIYTYLTAQRDRSGGFCVPKEALVQRYAPRKPDQIRKRYADDAHPHSALPRALVALQRAGILVLGDDAPPTHLRGRLVLAGVPRLADRGYQQVFCVADFADRGARARLVAPTDTAVVMSPGAPVGTGAPTRQDAPVGQHAPAAAPLPPRAPSADPYAATATLLVQQVRLGRRARAAATMGGWTDRALVHLLAELLHLRAQDPAAVRSPGGLAATWLADREPAAYHRPEPAAWAWLQRTQPTLPCWQLAQDAPVRRVAVAAPPEALPPPRDAATTAVVAGLRPTLSAVIAATKTHLHAPWRSQLLVLPLRLGGARTRADLRPVLQMLADLLPALPDNLPATAALRTAVAAAQAAVAASDADGAPIP